MTSSGLLTVLKAQGKLKRLVSSKQRRKLLALDDDGKRDEAAQRVPDAMVTEFQALGTREMVQDRLRRYRDVGVTTLKLGLDSAGPLGPARFELLENIVDLVEDL